MNSERSQVAPELTPPKTVAERMEFGRRIARERQKLGMTQRDFAEFLDLGQARISELERGVFDVRPALYGRLVDLLPELFQKPEPEPEPEAEPEIEATVSETGKKPKPWTKAELRLLRRMHVEDGMDFAEIGKALGRTETAIHNKWYRVWRDKHKNLRHKRPEPAEKASSIDSDEEEVSMAQPAPQEVPPLAIVETPQRALAMQDTIPEMLLEMLAYVSENLKLIEGDAELDGAKMSCAMAIKWMERHVARTRTDR